MIGPAVPEHKMTRAVRLLALLLLSALTTAVGAATSGFHLTSPDLPAGKPIAERFTANAFGCHGPNESPELHWSGAPAGTRSFAITMFDPFQPPASGWWHWIVYDLPATTTSLPHGIGDPGTGLPAGTKQGPADGAGPGPH